ncbi:MAG: hypothetical protein K0R46_408 [Herbinix sp.]|jgi:hypothetical protein|nr:hypothetical protein [Herbinix sp.]
MNNKIDIIVPWVDGSDPKWIKERDFWLKETNADGYVNSNIRYQDWENLQYWFRAVEKYMPWVNRVFLVTWGHIPRWLNLDCKKLKVVKHDEYIPKEYLPTFNSNTIEMNYHLIEELSENFILFNDDIFPLQPIEEEYYFKDNVIGDEAVEGHVFPVDVGPLSAWGKYVQVNNMLLINRHFQKREVQEKNWDKWYCVDYGELLERTRSLNYWYDFAGFRDPHMASALHKSTLAHIWEVEHNVLDIASGNKFRSYTDISRYVIRYWNLCEGNFNPRRTLGYTEAVRIDNFEIIAEGIKKQKWKMINLTEVCTPEEFVSIKRYINKALQCVFPDKSNFEL